MRVHPEVTGLLARGGIAGARAALQAAIRLEHSTIPPYLYSLYSLAPGGNEAAAQVIRSVVSEEMLHMALAVNVLNAIGGRPDVDSPLMLPRYPGSLPGTVEAELIVGLAPLSMALVRDTFLRIAGPDEPGGSQSDGPAAPLTIGQFYRQIRATLVALGDAAFTGMQEHQVTSDLLTGCVEVTDVRSACAALDLISDQRYVFGGDPVPVTRAAVYNAPVNPTSAAYPPGSAARRACDTFNYSYTTLLRRLHVAFNGRPQELSGAIGLMDSLRQQARGMMSGETTGGAPVGPTFEWLPVQ